jgi:hypothetical protein
MTMMVMSGAMMVMSVAMMMMSVAMMVFIIITWLAIRVDIARIVIVIGWWHYDHARDPDVNIDRCPRGDGTYSDGQPCEHRGDADSCHASLLR